MIKILSQDLINKIAAGEVVERPASVVKELTENAIDAGATRIEIIIEEGGIKLIQVKDNGCGMNQEDARLCLLSHATSKIESAEDLFSIHTLGFRGEALASIAAVSQFSLITRQENSEQGVRVGLDEKQEVILQPSAANQGTSVAVRNLFYNVPARQKFLKTQATEFTHILSCLQQFALIHPETEIKLEHNKKTIFHFQPSPWQVRVENILGKEFSSKLVQVSGNGDGIQLEGFIAKPELVHATHKNQYLFVNNRPVYDHLISRSVLDAYETMIPRGYFPAFVLRLELDPKIVDVNVHPRKSEVKFLNPAQIISFVKNTARKSLAESDLVKEGELDIFIVPPRTFSDSRAVPSYSSLSGGGPATRTMKLHVDRVRPSAGQVKAALEFNQKYSGGIHEIKNTPLEEARWKIIGQIHLAFVLVETPEGLQVFDQHAVSEIVNYGRLIKERDNGEICSQQLLLPEQVEVNREEKNILGENKELFENLGWEIDELSPTSFQISAVPEILKIDNLKIIFSELLDKLRDEKDIDMSRREIALLKFEACRGAVMFGDVLSLQEMQALLNQWLETPNNTSCEHGRPVSVRFTVEEMRRFFER